MTNYRVTLRRVIVHYAVVNVHANSSAEAEAKAKALARNPQTGEPGDLEWDYDESSYSVPSVHVEEDGDDDEAVVR